MNNHPENTSAEWLSWLVGADEDRRKEATLRLGGLTPEDSVPLQPLLDGLRSDNETVVFWCTVALGRVGEAAHAGLADLLSVASGHPKFGLRQAAVAAAPRVDPRDESVRLTLLGALSDPSECVRREALQALVSMRNLRSEDLAAIRSLENDPDPNVARWSEVALRNIHAGPRRLDA